MVKKLEKLANLRHAIFYVSLTKGSGKALNLLIKGGGDLSSHLMISPDGRFPIKESSQWHLLAYEILSDFENMLKRILVGAEYLKYKIVFENEDSINGVLDSNLASGINYQTILEYRQEIKEIFFHVTTEFEKRWARENTK